MSVPVGVSLDPARRLAVQVYIGTVRSQDTRLHSERGFLTG